MRGGKSQAGRGGKLAYQPLKERKGAKKKTGDLLKTEVIKEKKKVGGCRVGLSPKQKNRGGGKGKREDQQQNSTAPERKLGGEERGGFSQKGAGGEGKRPKST